MTTTAMTRERMDIREVAAPAYRAMIMLDARSAEGPLPSTLLDLVRLRVSQVNGCAYCVDSHSHDAAEGGEPLARVYAVAAWSETPWFDERERAAFALAEAMTRLSDGGDRVPDDVWADAADHYDEAELAQLVMVVTTINAWNRLGVTLRMVPPSFSQE